MVNKQSKTMNNPKQLLKFKNNLCKNLLRLQKKLYVNYK